MPATAGILCGYQHVQIGQRTVAHVIDKRDVLALVLDVTPGAVEEHFECRQSVEWRRLLRVRTYGQAQNQDSHKADEEISSCHALLPAAGLANRREGDRVDCSVLRESAGEPWVDGRIRQRAEAERKPDADRVSMPSRELSLSQQHFFFGRFALLERELIADP